MVGWWCSETWSHHRLVNDERNNQLADQYRKLAANEDNVVFGGRLAQYKYYDMAPVIEQVMKLWKDI